MQSGLSAASSRARVYQALGGGIWANDLERDLAARYESMSPGSGDLVRQGRRFHQRVTAWAAGQGIRVVIHAPAGYPSDPEPHLTASGRLIPGTHVFADPDGGAALVNQVRRADRPGVHAVQAGADDPARLIALPVVPGGQAVLWHLRMFLRWRDDTTAAGIVAAYGAVMPPGSLLAASVPLAGAPSPRSASGLLQDVTGPVHAHTAAACARWVAGAGLVPLRERVRSAADPRCAWSLWTGVARRL